MVENSLINELKELISNGAATANADDVLKSFELINQISEEVDYLKSDVEESNFSCQMVFSDIGKEYWIKFNNGIIEYDRGKLDHPSITLTASKDIGLGLLFGEKDANIMTPLGKLKVEGVFPSLRLFQELYEDVIDEFKKKY